MWEAEVDPCLHQNHVFAVRPKSSMLVPYYLAALLGCEITRTYFMRNAKQTTNLASTNKTTLGRLPLALPATNEQTRILDAIRRQTAPLDAAISRMQGEIALIREYRTRLISDVVTGQLDVREVARQLPDDTPAGEPVESEPIDEEIEEDALAALTE